MTREKHVPDSLRGSPQDTSIPEPYPAPDGTRESFPDSWTGTARTNWGEYCAPVHAELPPMVAKWYRRIYRPKHTGEGLLETDNVTVGNECDYIAETVGSTICDREFRLKRQRQVARIRADAPLDDIAGAIIASIRTIAHETGRDPTDYVTSNRA